ncbi:retrovirus-related pol polyprotein from transposon TNT 1-94 [Tanacetum coccineum]|uniref:Retrovirus-related pol polyprotein from transposon TNT 1-94 n=1 Tax=Tanacetum coccineum TaxID=301880 RepID=A0ABQ5BU31_9ASTR
MKDKVVPNTSQVKFKKSEVEDHHRISSISNKTKSVTACNDSLKSRTSYVNVVCATCGKCVFNSNHDACISKIMNDMNARTKNPKVVPISTRKPKSQAHKSAATPPKKTVASESTIQKSKSYYMMLYEKTNLEVAFRKSTCFVRDLQGNDLLTGNCGYDLYTISLQETTSLTPICFMAKDSPTQAWLWHRRLSHLNFDYINLLKRRMSGTEFVNKILHAYFKDEGIEHQTSTYRTPEQNGIVKRRNHTLVDAARTMLSASKLPLFFRAEAYGENLDKMKEKGDSCIMVGYSTQSKGYHVYNKRTRLIVESIHLRFDEIKEMSEMSVANAIEHKVDLATPKNKLTIRANLSMVSQDKATHHHMLQQIEAASIKWASSIHLSSRSLLQLIVGRYYIVDATLEEFRSKHVSKQLMNKLDSEIAAAEAMEEES